MSVRLSGVVRIALDIISISFLLLFVLFICVVAIVLSTIIRFLCYTIVLNKDECIIARCKVINHRILFGHIQQLYVSC